ncbi:hypothetical protein Pan241w_30040 [Gimesia alba]|uniref:Uncharacterized protein n=1 Tax=Gimesia alba TaxID=2527973 RepID=A0A517RGA6_9PLAN|nr:hypothetical protein Pan241w_30040 [Gimesia alba]
MVYLTRAKLTGICLGLITIAIWYTYESKPQKVSESSPPSRYISNGNDVQYFPASPEEEQKLQEEMLKYRREQKRSTRP